MLISHKYKFITIDIPKTGSRSLRESLAPLDIVDIIGEPNVNAVFYQHGTAAECKNSLLNIGLNFNNYYSICFIRNPWDRYFSFFKYFKSYGEKYLRRDESINWKDSQLNQGKTCVELFKGKDDRAVLKTIILNNRSQDSYYCDENGEIIVDHIASFENLRNEFVFLCGQVGIDAPILQHGNKSKDSFNMPNIYNQELIDLVAQKEKSVIGLKGYEY